MKQLLILAFLLLPLLKIMTFAQTDVTNNVSEYLVVSGTFNESIKIWQDRWKLYNGTIKSINDSDISNKLGYYAIQPYTINNHKCYKQINGNNYIWFGHKLNPVNSYDAWYIGNTIEHTHRTETNTLINPLTPLTQPAIPCSPTFLPNRKGINTAISFYKKDITTISESDPSIQRLFLSQSEMAELILLNIQSFDLSNVFNLSEINNNIIKMSVNGLDNLLTITVETSATPANHLLMDVYRSHSLNDEFKILYSNVVVNTTRFSFNLPLNGHIGFYKIIYK